MRLFVALELPEVLRKTLASVAETFMNQARQKNMSSPGIKWVPTANLHITLKFIGQLPPEQLPNAIAALSRIKHSEPLQAQLAGCGLSVGSKGRGVFWANVQPTPALHLLVDAIESALEPLKIAKETRTFLPHVTLARYNDRHALPVLRNFANNHQHQPFGSLTTDQFHLIESKTLPTGPIYSKIASFQFTTTANT